MPTEKRRSKGEELFIDQMTRKLTVDWAFALQATGALPNIAPVYRDYALAKGWLTKDETSLTSSGWTTAARFLKR